MIKLKMNIRIKYIVLASFLLLTISCNKNPVTPPLQLSDSTSHNFVWELDTLGNFQSNLHSVWGTSSDNFWAVGLLYLDTILGSNIAHWDGNEWSYENILEGDLFSIIGFSGNDIWAVGDWYGAPTTTGAGSYIVHWNGQTWGINKLNYEAVRAIWGKSSNSLYAVGYYGTILHYNGSTWSKMNSGTKLHLKDVWGTSDTDIYAAGGDDSDGTGILLHYDGIIWEKIYERKYQAGIPSGYTTTIYGVSKDKYYLHAVGQYIGMDSIWIPLNAPTDNTRLEKIRGYSDKNFFFIGHFGLLVHWNGKSWHRYDEFFRKPDGDLLLGVWVGEKDVVIVGRSDKTARGIVYRGKMIY